MANVTISVSKECPFITKLEGKKYSENFTKFSFHDLKDMGLKNMYKGLNAFVKTFENEFNPDDTALAVKSEDGFFEKFYGPMVVISEGKLVIQNFNKEYDLSFKEDNTNTIETYAPAPIEVEGCFVKTTFNDFENVVMKISLINSEKETVTHFMVPVKWLDIKDQPDADDLNRFLRRGNWEAIKKQIGTKGGNSYLKTYKLKNLEDGDQFQVTSYKHLKFNTHESFVLTVQNQNGAMIEDENGNKDYLPETFGVWANAQISRILQSNPEISNENPATLFIKSKKKVKNGVSVDAPLILPDTDTDDDEDEIDFGF